MIQPDDSCSDIEATTRTRFVLLDGLEQDTGAVENHVLVAAPEAFAKFMVIPQGGREAPHLHHTWTMIVILGGRVTVEYGAGLEFMTEAGAGTFIYIPPEMPHSPSNSRSEPVVCVVMRNATEEKVVPFTAAATILADAVR